MARITHVMDEDALTFKFHDTRNWHREKDPDWVSDEIKLIRMKS